MVEVGVVVCLKTAFMRFYEEETFSSENCFMLVKKKKGSHSLAQYRG